MNAIGFSHLIFSTPLVNISVNVVVCEDFTGSIDVIPSLGNILRKILVALDVEEGYYELMSKSDRPLEVWFKYPEVMMIHGFDGYRYCFKGKHRRLKMLEPILKMYVEKRSKLYATSLRIGTCNFRVVDLKSIEYQFAFNGHTFHSLESYLLLVGRSIMSLREFERYYKAVLESVPLIEEKIRDSVLEICIRS